MQGMASKPPIQSFLNAALANPLFGYLQKATITPQLLDTLEHIGQFARFPGAVSVLK